MNQLIANLSGGSSINGLWTTGSGKVEAIQGNAQTFEQTLVSMMLGGTSFANGGSALQSLVIAGLADLGQQNTGEPEQQELVPMIENVLGQLNDLDQAIADNPSLLLVLQAWLQGFQELALPQHNEAAAMVETDETPAPVLSQHPETMRFAIQDALVQLMQASQQQTGQFPSAMQSGQLVAALQQVLHMAQGNNQTAEHVVTGSTGNSNWIAALEQNVQAILNGGTSQETRNGEHRQNNQASQAQVLTIIDSTSAKTQATFTNLSSPVEGAEPVVDVESGLHTGSVVTVGQLAMRDGIAAPVKPAAPSVPVEHFGKEMGGFLVSKLEIVKLQGMSQARISLYPEHLGQVDVKITMQNGQLIAQFVTEHAFARESLEGQMAQLRSALQAQGLQVNKLEVTQNTSLSSHMYQDGRQPGSGTQQQQSGSKRREVREEDVMALGDLNEEWNEWISEVRAREENYGSSFVARV